MGRAFEYRKARKLKRWGHMARTFTKLGKEIEIAVKAAGPDPSGNTRLRILIQNAKAENMPKENIERAIKRATEKDAADYKEVIYEGYGPHGIAFLVETATDNTNRTVANVRMHFNKCGGALGNSGSVAFMFEHKCTFKFRPTAGTDPEELELEMIDLGVDEFYAEEDGVTVYAPYESFGAIQKWLDDKGFEIVSGESVRIPVDTKELDAAARESVEKLVERTPGEAVEVLEVIGREAPAEFKGEPGAFVGRPDGLQKVLPPALPDRSRRDVDVVAPQDGVVVDASRAQVVGREALGEKVVQMSADHGIEAL